ncbi:MAG TPA: tripartite tricarboxylate transporter substrate binding protein [Xanthobacteraceae bacterium]|jgi:tripartite-type tricarboxylate transporter receptor subunit TctC|nr:tripartite tricarboxylate transporter substrate binding protein [Xanthobacteraceae bacterium]
MNRRDLLALGLASLSARALTPRPALAQGQYPERPIKLMVAFSAGGVNDVVARQWAERVKTLLGTVYVENQGGGTGTIATGEAARAPGDGYTILLGSTSTMVLNPMTMAKVPYDPARDFVPIAIIAVSTTSIVVHPSVPATTLAELIAYAKAQSGKLSYGSAGSGTMSNLSGELFKQLTGLNDLVHIPYKGAGPGISDLVSGHIPMMTPNVTGQLLEFHRTGKIRILAVNAAQRLAAAPEIPTAIEQGVPGMIGLLFLGLFAPAATPRAIVDRIAEATRAAMADVEFQKVLIASGLEAIPDSNSDKAKQFIDEEIARWGPVVKAARFKVD